MSEKAKQEVAGTVTQVEVDMDDFLSSLDASNVLLPEETKPSIFSTKKVDTAFLDNPEKVQKIEKPVEKSQEEIEASEILDNLLEEEEENPTPVAVKAGGRAKISKDGTIELMNKLITDGKLIPFEDEKPLEEYSMNDFIELIEANFADRERQIKETTPVEFFESLPDELQAATKYVLDGGQDIKGFFKVLSQVQETRELDPSNEHDQERIVREYLSVTNFGTPEEIEEEIDSWKDRDELQSRANKFKPKLDAMHERVMQQKLAQQEEMKRKQQAQAKKYMDTVYETLKPGELNGLKLDKRTQEILYTGLVQPSYPSISGRPTNLLGHLLEKYQYVEPRHDLIAEALWLLSDPEAYRAKIKEQGSSTAAAATARMLKSEEARKGGSSSSVVEQEDIKQRRIPRNNNFFKR